MCMFSLAEFRNEAGAFIVVEGLSRGRNGQRVNEGQRSRVYSLKQVTFGAVTVTFALACWARRQYSDRGGAVEVSSPAGQKSAIICRPNVLGPSCRRT